MKPATVAEMNNAVEQFQRTIKLELERDMERRLGIGQSVETVLDNSIKTLQKVVDIRNMSRGDDYASGGQTAVIKNIQKALTARILKRDADAAVAKTAAIKNIQKALTARILKGENDGAVAKTAAIKNIQKSLTARILKGDDEAESSGCNVHYEINFNNGSSASAGSEDRAIKNIQKSLTARILKRFATGMNGDEDLGQDIIMKGEPFHYRGYPPTVGGPEKFDNTEDLWKTGDSQKMRKVRANDQDCSISESDNWKGAQQCVESWECRGARMCERGGWCSGYDGCEGTSLTNQTPGLSNTH